MASVILIEIVLCFLALVTLLPVSLLFVQVVMALPAYRPRGMLPGRRPAVAVVIPAHDAALRIADGLRTIMPQLVAGDRLLVVADNCSDDTATIAAAEGAEVIERTDSERRGKGYALDFGVRHLEQTPPEVIVMIDDDCAVDSGTVDCLARVCLKMNRPVQGLYVMHSPEGAGLKTRIAEFAWLVRNYVRPLGYHRLGLPCQLMGSGMAFPWRCISRASLASGHVVEDLKLGIDLAHAGMPALFCPEARVASCFPSTGEGIYRQRTRWEHGHLGMILGDAPRLFVEAIAHHNMKLMALVIELCVPPLALLMLLVLTVFAGSAVFFAATGAALPLWLATAALVILGLSVLLAWARYGRQVISLGSLACAPIYALWKIPVYLRFLVKRQVEWVRSKRDGD